MIRFVPVQTSLAPTSGAWIADGAYKVDSKGGVPVGTHKIEIEALRQVASFQPDNPGDLHASQKGLQQYLPARFNRQSELEITIEPGSPEVTKNFELTD